MKNNNQLYCNNVLDLLPNYIEHVTCESTNRDIEEHLSGCKSCKREYLNMIKSTNENEYHLKETEIVKDGLFKTRRMYMLKGIFMATIFLSLLVPGIVDYVINKRFTWYYIVVSSLILVTAIAGVAIFKRNNKIMYTLGTATVLIPFYLFIMESIINRYFLTNSISWFMSRALPTYCVWVAIIWITFLLVRFINIPNGYCIVLGFCLAIIGSILTNGIFLRVSLVAIVKSSWISILVCCLCAFISVMVGFYQQFNKR